MYILIVYTNEEAIVMLTARVFKSGNSQAIRIPKELNTTEKEFFIKKSGNCYYLIPKDDPWALLRQTIGQAEEDITFDRNQPMLNDLPERERF